ncbi:MAG TPA: hypothetical protein PLG15_04370 [Candidatus Gastranaerophilaceae bacterium]|nr:hypothetical protein [Candidatus Gastranaerophilaceae bacterium]HPT41602.1 hypothetical protein [Candidatus Gastranaerophilaceae bacterium]
MIKYFSKAFKITNENIILATPLVLFLFILSLYIEFTKRAPENVAAAILLLVTVLFMIGAFFAGWLFMTKQAVKISNQVFEDEEEKAKASFNLLKDFNYGIGEFFLPFVGAAILYGTILVVIVIAAYKAGMHFIGDPGIDFVQIKRALTSTAEMKALITSLSTQQLAKINAWNFMLIGVTFVQSFLTMFWGCEIIYRTKNPIIALFKSIQSIFKKPLGAIILFLYISFVNFIVSFINAILAFNSILYFLSMLLYFYFIVYIIVLIFFYYEREILKQEENNSNSRTDSIGQKPPGDSDSKEE